MLHRLERVAIAALRSTLERATERSCELLAALALFWD